MSVTVDALRRITNRRVQKSPLHFPESEKKQLNKKRWILFVVIGCLFLYGIYAVGFYQGMRLAPQEESEVTTENSENPSQPDAPVTQPLKSSVQTKEEDHPLSTPVSEPVESEEGTVSQDLPAEKEIMPEIAPPFFTVQLIVYTKEARAREEVKMLEGQGFQAFVLPGIKYQSVCMGRFSKHSDAGRKISEIRKFFGEALYRDAYVRYIKESF